MHSHSEVFPSIEHLELVRLKKFVCAKVHFANSVRKWQQKYLHFQAFPVPDFIVLMEDSRIQRRTVLYSRLRHVELQILLVRSWYQQIAETGKHPRRMLQSKSWPTARNVIIQVHTGLIRLWCFRLRWHGTKSKSERFNETTRSNKQTNCKMHSISPLTPSRRSCCSTLKITEQ